MSGDVNFLIYVSNGSPNLVDPFGLLEGSPANSARRANIAKTAKGYAGSHAWDVAADKGKQYPKNSWKCSKFVCDVIAEAGAPIFVTVDGKRRCPTAGELANSRWAPKHWRRLEPGETVLPGDIAAYQLPYDPNEAMPSTGHSGIVELDGVMAAHFSGVYVVPNQFSGTAEPNVSHLRYTGE